MILRRLHLTLLIKKIIMWKQSLSRIIIWFAAEVILNCVGLDDLADYSEYVFERNATVFDYTHRVPKTSANT